MPRSFKHLTSDKRIRLQNLKIQGQTQKEIAKDLGVSQSTVSRELKRNKVGEDMLYNPISAQKRYENSRKACKKRLRCSVREVREYLRFGFEQRWSPEIISHMLRTDKGIIVAASTIYRAVKSGIYPEMTEREVLRRRGKRKYKRGGGKTITSAKSIHMRDEIIDRRERKGDWEGDTVWGGKGTGGLLTLIDRKTRFLIIILITGKNAAHVGEAMTKALKGHCPHSITLDNGAEFADYARIENELQTDIYFTDTHSPWQRGSNENVNELIRWFFPKGYDFTKVTQNDVDKVCQIINNRPRKHMGWRTAHDAYYNNS